MKYPLPNWSRRLPSTFLVLLLLLTPFGLVACEKKGPMEKAGEKIDNAIDDVEDKAEEITDEVEDVIDEATDGEDSH